MAAYPLARYQFRGREQLFLVFVLGLLFPVDRRDHPAVHPHHRQLHLGNTWWGVALPQAAFALPVTIVILRPFLQALPERARGGRAARRRLPDRVLLADPACRCPGPGMVTVGVLAFVASWNAYLLPLLLLQGDMKTLPLGVADFSSRVLLRHRRRASRSRPWR